jgi:hypothetical protein
LVRAEMEKKSPRKQLDDTFGAIGHGALNRCAFRSQEWSVDRSDRIHRRDCGAGRWFVVVHSSSF